MVDRPEFWTVDRTVGEYNVLALAHAGSREQLADIVDELRSASGHRAQRDLGAVGTAALGVPLGSLLAGRLPPSHTRAYSPTAASGAPAGGRGGWAARKPSTR